MFSRFVTESSKQWKNEISSMLVNETHDCNVLSLFTNSKLFQRLLCIGVGANDLCKLQLGDNALAAATDVDAHWLASLNGHTSKSANSSDTEAMEYEDIDRYLVTVDSAAFAKDMMERRPSSKSTSKLTRPRRQHSLTLSEQGVPSPKLKDHDPDFTVGQKLSLKIKRKYTKRKKTKQNTTDVADAAKVHKNRVVKIIDPGTNHLTSTGRFVFCTFVN